MFLLLFAPAAFAAQQGLQQEFGVAPQPQGPIGGQQPGFGGQQPGFGAPAPQTPMPQTPMPQAPMPQAPMPQAQSQALSIVGAWSSQFQTPLGPAQGADAYSADGRYVTAALVNGQYLFRSWGSYRTTQISQNQLRLEMQLQGSLPHQTCQQAPGAPLQCQPFQLPPTATATITFSSPNQFQIVFADTGLSVFETRDPNPYLLQQQAPEQIVIQVPAQAPPSYGTGPNGGGGGSVGMQLCNLGQTKCASGWMQACEPGVGGGTRWSHTAQRCDDYGRPSYNHCDDLQQQRICSINNGTLVHQNGCLVCVN